ncbi:hypothetical protein AMAG_15927 [Allomyces macrogynus ATCC 38327]|uniref:UBX domain-containing protein n=1 Tax=Allomyces macrogynus (strain ATCC 38327) TaxID=578462 RepID=A0A0L0TBB4_ALLM3|nr:hypothetical protein AMAG_15927 [Allomyces macrogynus ATCC 38327]|eukprot:KNE71985.1 hypothetical protein AMAG_15927 [Allomyces macrogynus ATCC 38327]
MWMESCTADMAGRRDQAGYPGAHVSGGRVSESPEQTRRVCHPRRRRVVFPRDLSLAIYSARGFISADDTIDTTTATTIHDGVLLLDHSRLRARRRPRRSLRPPTMADINPDDLIQFCELTGADPMLAAKYLRVADRDLSNAVTLFMDLGGTDLPDIDAPALPPSRPAAPPARRAPPPAFAENDDDDDVEMPDYEEMDEDEDDDVNIVETTAAPAPSAPEVRPPPPSWAAAAGLSSSGGSASSLNSRDRARGNAGRGSASSSTGRLAALGVNAFGFEVPAASSSTQRPFYEANNKLHSLFAPPADLMFKGTFDNAKEIGRREHKWVLVDLHDPTEFACEVLNRDLWKHHDVQEAVRANFLFLQPRTTDNDGRAYRTLYPVAGCPHVAILDPRTGERMAIVGSTAPTMSAPITRAPRLLKDPAEFVTFIFEFLDAHPLVTAAPAVAAAPSVGGAEDDQLAAALRASAQDDAALQAALKASVSAADEDEALQAALRASLADAPSASPKNDVVDMTDHESDAESDAGPTNGDDPIAALTPLTDPEPPAGAGTTRVQARLPDGQRLVRRFRLADPVSDLYRWIKAKVPEANDAPFALVYVRQDLSEVLEQSVADAGLANAAVAMSYL